MQVHQGVAHYRGVSGGVGAAGGESNMSISCDCSADGYEGAKFSIETFPVARKEHKCCECRETIKPGQQYQNIKGLWEGRFEIFKTCMPCYRIRKHYCPHGYIFETLQENISDCLGFNYTDADTEDDE